MDYNQFLTLLNPIAKWMHIIAGITWIGLLYFFNFINVHVAAKMDGDTKKQVIPELMPRTLFWFRWGAAWTLITGIVLLYVIFWAGSLSIGESVGNNMFDADTEVTMWAHIMLLVTFLAVFVYDFLYKSALAKNVRLVTIISLLFILGVEYLMIHCGQFGYRAFNIHIGTMFGTMMAFNVWFIIWPNQKKVLGIVEATPEEKPVALKKAVIASRINTLFSLPMLLSMVAAQNLY